MKVNDGESSSSQELKPSANFCDAYLSYLSKNFTGLPTATSATGDKTSSDSTGDRGVLRVGTSNSPGSKWTFYNTPSPPQSADLRVGRANTRRIGDRFAARELGVGRGAFLTKSSDRQITGKEQLRVQIEQLSLRKKDVTVNGKRIIAGRRELNAGKIDLKQRGKQLPVAQRQLKVSVELINLTDSFVKVGSEVIKVHKAKQTDTSQNAKPELHSVPGRQKVDKSKDLSLNRISSEPTLLIERSSLPCLDQSSIEQTSLTGLDCAAVGTTLYNLPSNKSLDSRQNLSETINLLDESKDDQQLSADASNSDGVETSLDVDKSQVIEEKSVHSSSDRSDSSGVKQNETCIELSDDSKNDEEVKEPEEIARKTQGRSPYGGIDVRCIRSKRSAGVKPPGRFSEGGERTKFSPSSFRKNFKNSWRRKIVKKHLVSEKLKTQATRLLNAERPKRNVVAKRIDGASIGLSRREEVELTRALYASLHTRKQKNNKPTVEGATNEDDVTEASRDGASQALSLFARSNTYPCQTDGFLSINNRIPGVQAQRKFASAPNSVLPVVRKRGKRPGNILVSKKARTEDFLTFLCLRERTVLPSLLDFIHGLQNMGSQNNVIKSSSSTVVLLNGHDQHVIDHNPTFSEMQSLRPPTPVKFSSCDVTRLEETVSKSSRLEETVSKSSRLEETVSKSSRLEETLSKSSRLEETASKSSRLEETASKSSTDHINSEDPKHGNNYSGTNVESANDDIPIRQDSTAVCETLPSEISPTLTVDPTPKPVGFPHTDSTNKVDMSSSSKVDSSISVKNSSKIATSHVNQRKLELPKSSSRRLRPSTRALTAARADEQLMLAKQRLSPISSETDEQPAVKNASEVKVDLGDAAEDKECLNDALEDKGNLNNALDDKEVLNRVEEVMDIGTPVKILDCRGVTGGSCLASGGEDLLESRQSSLVEGAEIGLLVEMEIDDCATSSKSSCDFERPAVVNGLNYHKSDDDDDEVKKLSNPGLGRKDPSQRRLLRARTGKKDLEDSGSPAKKSGVHTKFLRMSKSHSKDSLADEAMTASSSECSDQLPNDKPTLGCHIPRIPLSISFFPSSDDPPRIVNGPSYHPSEEQFEDPIQYIELIHMNAEPFGMCRVVPPDGWKVECCVPQELRFNTNIQYINRLRHRCGPSSFQMDCIRKHLDSQKIQMEQFPLLNGIQVDLVALSKAVKQCGGLQNVIDKNTWSKVAKIMHLPKYDKDKAQRLCQIYCRYLLSYDTLSEDERQKVAKQVTGRRQPNNYDPKAHCFARGKTRTLGEFFNVARSITGLYFDQEPTTAEVEVEYFRLLGESEKHVAVHMVHIDTEQCGSAFPDRKDSPYARHGWNFNVLRKNEGSLLNNLGRVEGVTSSTLHVGMLFSTSCWTRHRHYLPFIHYLHTGADIIWYCIPASETQKFKKFVESEIPTCKDLELGSEQSQIMVSPDELVLHGISVSRVVQRHGEYVVIFPESFTAYVCSGYSISESMYFATPEWIIHGCKAIQVLREKSLPEMFSLTKVLFSVTFTGQPRPSVVEAAIPYLQETINTELSLRKKVLQLGLSRTTVSHDEHVLCEICKTRCFLSAVVSEKDDVVYCLDHALSRLQKKKKFNSYKMLYQFEEKDLKHMMQKAIEISKQSSDVD